MKTRYFNTLAASVVALSVFTFSPPVQAAGLRSDSEAANSVIANYKMK